MLFKVLLKMKDVKKDFKLFKNVFKKQSDSPTKRKTQAIN